MFFQLWGCFLTLCRLIHYRQSKTPGGYRGFAFLMRGEIVSCSTILVIIIPSKCVQIVTTS